jgi:ABC-2 type transport system ATP-binding protein
MIEIRNLRKTYRSKHGPVDAVKDITLSVEDGEIFGFLGPNGAGKTTTLRMLTTLLPPTSGSAIVAGADLLKDTLTVRRNVGYVSQQGGTRFGSTGRSELVLQARLYGMTKSEAVARTDESVRSFELGECVDRPVETYSGGQKRRLDLALGLIHRPKLVFLDEPTTGLDPQSRAHLWDWVRRLRTEFGTTVFLTTHYLDEADALCDRLAIIDHGTIVAQGTSAELKRQIAGDVVVIGLDGGIERAGKLLAEQPYVRELEIRDDDTIRLYVDKGETAVASIMRLFDEHSLPLVQASVNRPTLDDVFLRQTGYSLRDAAV